MRKYSFLPAPTLVKTDDDKDKKKRGQSIPSYVSPNGKIYDQFYIEMPEETAKLQLMNSSKLLSPPKSSDKSFRRYEDYESALIDWQARVLHKLNAYYLPTQAGRSLPRPAIFQEDIIDDVPSHRKNAKTKKLSHKNIQKPAITSPSLSSLSEDSSIQSKMSLRSASTSSFTSSSTTTTGWKASASESSDPKSELETEREVADTSERSTGGVDVSSEMSSEGSIGPMSPFSSFNYHHKNTETWADYLYPSEPEPTMYNTFEEYNQAMTEWASIVYHSSNQQQQHHSQGTLNVSLNSPASSITGLPYHAHELPKIIPIITASKASIMDRGERLIDLDSRYQQQQQIITTQNMSQIFDEKVYSFRPGLPQYHFIDRSIPSIQPLHSLDDDIWFSDTNLIKLNNENINIPTKLEQSIATWTKRKNLHNQNLKFSNLTYYYDCYGETHECLVNPKGFLSSKEGVGTIYLRRTAGTTSTPNLGSRDDDKKPVEKRYKKNETTRIVPTFDIELVQNELSKNSYLEEINLSYQVMLHKYRYHEHYSWWNPSKATESIVDEQVASLSEFFKQNSYTIEKLIPIMKSDIYLDVFFNVLAKQSDKGSLLDQIVNVIPSSSTILTQLLKLFEESRSTRVHGKVATLLDQILSVDAGAKKFTSIFLSLNTQLLSYLPYILSFFKPNTLDIYGYSHETLSSVKMALLSHPSFAKDKSREKSVNSIMNMIDSILRWYYVGLAQREAGQLPGSYQVLRDLLDDYATKEQTSIVSSLTNDSLFLQNILFSMLSHRSKSISSLFLVIAARLFSLDTVLFLYKQPNLIFDQLISMGKSKLTHVKSAARVLVSNLSEGNFFALAMVANDYLLDVLTDPQSQIFSFYLASRIKKDLEKLQKTEIRDISSTGSGSSVIISPASSSSSSTPSTNQSSKFILKINQWLKDKYFHTLLNKLDNSVNEVSTLVTELIAMMSKSLSIQYLSDTKKDKSKQDLIVIQNADVEAILEFLVMANGKDLHLENTAKKHMLASLRYLSRSDHHWEFFKDNSKLHEIVSKLCKNKNSGVCREAWHLVYSLAKYHPGIVEPWIESNIFKNYVSLLNVGESSVVTFNGLRYILMLFEKSKRKMKKGGKDKGVDNDVRALSNYFANHRILHVNVHMIYKNSTRNYPGGIYYAIARFYNILLSSDSLSKLLKDTIKKSVQFKEGLNEVATLMKIQIDKAPRKKDRRAIWN
eukprot:TRINITY_DN3040_c0_g1_i1.p1 TRINITY_DN3040_c0_g1~~TRINITY_DN3040_c0_g1_i1.p1  ORF type:complete len:1214 (-),score=370.92 TRINITY_DN3040_c0_g1_i1:1611-5252(-)